MDGAAQIVVPATVSLLCICIVFVPMFCLRGVAGFLFGRWREAVVFAMIGSYHPVAHAGADHGDLSAQAACHVGATPSAAKTAQSAGRFQRGFEHRFETLRGGYRRLLRLALAPPHVRSASLPSCASFALFPFLGRTSSRRSMPVQIKLHVRAPTGTRIEETPPCSTASSSAIRQIIPPTSWTRSSTTSACRSAASTSPTAIAARSASRTRDILISLKRGPADTDGRFVETARRLPRASRHHFRLPAGRHHQPDSQFRSAGADRRAGRRQRSERLTAPMRTSCCSASAVCRALSTRASSRHSMTDLNVNVDRTLGQHVGLTEQDVTDQHAGHPGRQHADRADLLAEPEERRVLPDRRADAAILVDSLSNLQNLPTRPAHGRQLLGGLATVTTQPVPASCRTTTCGRSSTSTRRHRPRSRRRCGRHPDAIIDDRRRTLPSGSQSHCAGR